MPVTLARELMGTRFELVLSGGDPGRLQAAGEEALDLIEEEDRRLSIFRRDSLTSLLNARAAQEAVRVDDEFLDLLEICAEVHRESRGAFDPTVAPLMESLGFRDDADAPEHASAPVGFEQVEINREARTVRMPPGMKLDLGAVGKGWALEKAVELLRERRITSALLHGGTSTVVAIGVEPYAEGWTVALRIPEPGTEPRLEKVLLRDQAFSVSSPAGRTVEQAGVTLGHVIDPRTRRPVHTVALAAVKAASPTRADAWSTALLVLGQAPAAAPLDWSLVVLTSPSLTDAESDAASTA